MTASEYTTSLDVTAHAIQQFCSAIGDEHPAHTNPQAAHALGYSSVLAPPTFLAQVCIPLLEEFLASTNTPLARIVHAGQGFSFARPVCAGDHVTASLSVRSRKRFGDGEMILTDLRVHSSSEEIANAPMTLLLRPESDEQPATTPASASQEIAAGTPPPESLTEWKKGLTLPHTSTRITREALVRYAAASGDLNPIHYSDYAARSIGLHGVIAHGMLTMAHALRTLTDSLQDPGVLRDVSVSFNAPVSVPDDGVGTELLCGAEVSAHDPEQRTARITLTGATHDASVLKRARAAVAWS